MSWCDACGGNGRVFDPERGSVACPSCDGTGKATPVPLTDRELANALYNLRQALQHVEPDVLHVKWYHMQTYFEALKQATERFEALSKKANNDASR